MPLYLMTSQATHEETVEFLRRANGFGLARWTSGIFCQGAMPAVDAESGRVAPGGARRFAVAPTAMAACWRPWTASGQ